MPLENWEDGGGESGGEKGSARCRCGRARASHGITDGRSMSAMKNKGYSYLCALLPACAGNGRTDAMRREQSLLQLLSDKLDTWAE